MNAMTLSSRHRIRNSSPGGLRPSTLLLVHGGSPQYFYTWMGEATFLFLSNRRDREPNPDILYGGVYHFLFDESYSNNIMWCHATRGFEGL